MYNTIAELLLRKGVKNPYQLARDTKINSATAYRLWKNPEVLPSREVMEILCTEFNVQPGDFLKHVPDSQGGGK